MMDCKTKLIGGGKTDSLWRVVLLVALAASLVLSMLPAVQANAEPYVFDPDGNQTGSLTIYKYDSGGDTTYADENSTQDEILGALEDIQSDSNYSPMEGVVFSYLRVGGVTQYVDDSDSTVSIAYEVDQNYWNDLGLQQSDAAYVESGTYYFSTKTLSDALSHLSQADLESFMSSAGATEMNPTDSDGMTRASNLQLGLYLVVETTYPAQTTRIAEPFFVSIPMTDYSSDGEWSWIYDVTAIPKNSTEDFGIWKSVIENGHETNVIDAEIGQARTFVIRAEVPSSICSLQTFTVTDELDAGFTPTGTPVVYGLSDGSRQQLTDGTDYRYSTSGNTLTFAFDGTKLGSSDNTAIYNMVEIRYEAYLNAGAQLGIGTGNKNSAKLTFSSSPSGGSGTTDIPADSVTVYTYGIDLLKYGEGGPNTGQLDGVCFKLYRDEGLTEEIDVSLSDDSSYYYLTGSTGGTTVDEMETSNGGQLVVHGLEANTTYYLMETSTLEGYSLLAHPIEITITSTEATFGPNENGTYVQTSQDASYYLDAGNSRWQFELPQGTAAGAYVGFGSNAVYDSGSGGTALDKYAPEEYDPKGVEYTLRDDGLIGLYVQNSKSFELPITGDKVWPWLLVGALIVAAAVASVAYAKRKTRSGAES